MSSGVQIVILAFFASVIALIGGVVFLYNEKISETLEKHSVPFAAGVLLTVSLAGLLPEAVHHLGEKAFIIILLTFVVVFLFEHLFFEVHHHGRHEHGVNYKSAIPLVIIGDTIHNFIDGVAIASTFFVSPGLGLITTLSTFLHEVPHEIGDFGILLKAGWKRGKILIVNILSASTTILGALFVITFLPEGPAIGYLLAIAAGLFLYLGASDFLPHIEHEEKKPIVSIASFLLGVAVMGIALTIVPHTREEDIDKEPRFAGRQEAQQYRDP